MWMRMVWMRTRAKVVAGTMATALVVAAMAASAAASEGVQVEPGLWEFTSSLSDPLGGGAVPQTHRTCVREGNITPEVVMKRVRECRIYQASVQGTVARWKMKCSTPAGPMTGSGSLRSAGSAVSGSLEMTFTVGSVQIPTTSSFKGRRVGRCG